MSSKYDGRSGSTWRRLRAQILESSDVCWLCGRNQPPADTVDHVLPLSIYPELAHDLSNLRPAHRTCNSRKGAGFGGAEAIKPMRRSRRW
jgi:5-methylcytosine-specific restriction endonuclease McrA